ncbi:class II bacteriocin [Enterococcus faecalis]|uniref:class II bacteriocin n=1 Tax=Enterococcus faecalis TaxID=1351 RepID=UPI0022E430B5|nr:class II bacteriocin [Enterococcus faecalis]
MKKKLVKGLAICGMTGIGFTALGTNVEATTYYGNGLYCNKQKCWVDWNKASKEIGKIIVNGWVQHGPWAPR